MTSCWPDLGWRWETEGAWPVVGRGRGAQRQQVGRGRGRWEGRAAASGLKVHDQLLDLGWSWEMKVHDQLLDLGWRWETESRTSCWTWGGVGR